MGDEEEMCAFEESILALEKHCAQYNSLKEEVILDIVKGRKPQVEKTGDTIVFSVTGKPIVPRSPNQLKLVQMCIRDRRTSEKFISAASCSGVCHRIIFFLY